MTVQDIYDYLDIIAPFKRQASSDNCGLNVGSFKKEVCKIGLCADVTVDVIEECKSKSIDLVISHHPIIFNPLKTLEAEDVVYKLVQSGVSHIASHTSYDVTEGGLSDIMLELLGLPASKEIISAQNSDGSGYGRISVTQNEFTASELVEKCKQAFSCTSVRYYDAGIKIRRIGVCSGGGSSELENAIEQKCDAYITGDVKWSAFVHAKNMGITLIDAGHFHTENTICVALKKQLDNKFKEIETIILDSSKDLCSYL